MNNDQLAELADMRRACELLITRWEQTEATRELIVMMLSRLAERLDTIYVAQQENRRADAADWWKHGPEQE